jgi:cytoplasmic iron level regulating protein YaaA (DUF328/UPF0246 family)
VLIVLPPSETKAAGGTGGPLQLDDLSFPELNPTRRKLLDALSTLADDVPESLRVLKLTERQIDEVHRNTELWDSPTTPALRRYTGVLYDALDIPSLSTAEQERAGERLAVASALFGLLRGNDMIPAYRLSAGNSLPGVGSLRRVWRAALEPVLAEISGLVLDLRSSAYAALAAIPGAVGLRVLSENELGQRKVISHHNKAHKGKLARAVVQADAEPETVEDVIDLAHDAGLRVERESARQLCLVVPA